MAQPEQPQEFTMSSTGNPEITSSSVLHGEKEHNAEKSSPAAPSDYETQRTSPKDLPVISTVEVFHDQNISTPSDRVVSPLPNRQAMPVPIPSLPRDDLSEHGVNSDGIFDKNSSSSMWPQKQSPGNPAHIEEFVAPDQNASKSASNASRSKQRATVDEQPVAISQPRSELYEHTIKPLLNQNTVAKEWEGLQSPSTASTPEGFAQYKARVEIPTASETVHSISPVHLSNAEDALHSSRVASKDEASRADAESEVSPINITIGRVVVRATQAAQPTPVKKRVLRPAQSLDEYLKQRERGSR